LPHLLNCGQTEKAAQAAAEYADIFGKDHFYVEIIRTGIKEPERANTELLKLAERLRLPLVAANDVHYLKREYSRAHEVLMCIQSQHTLNDPNRIRFNTDEFYFKSG